MGRFPHFWQIFPHGVQSRFAGAKLFQSYTNSVETYLLIAYPNLFGVIGQVQGVLDDDGFSVDFF